MNYIDVDEIVVPEDGQRKHFDTNSIAELADSIGRLGLIHAVVLDAGDDFMMRAGRRRLLAAKELKRRGVAYQHNGITLPIGTIPYTRTSDLDPEELFEIELEENIQRVDLSWQERAQAMSDLYTLHSRKLGHAPTPAEFAREVTGEVSPQEVTAFRVRATGALTLAKHLDDPDVSKAKSQKEALSIIQRKQGAELRQELNRRLAEQNLLNEECPHKIHNASAFDFLPTVQSASVDLIITDPPYGIDMDKMGTQSGSSSGHVHTYVDSEDYADDCTRLLAEEGFRVLHSQGALYMCCDVRLWPRWVKYFEQAGFYVWPFPIIWNKAPVGSLLGNANGPRHVYEAVLYAVKGGRAVNMVGNDVLNIAGPQQNKLHPAEKPVELYSQFLTWSATPGDTILDPFCGCGPIFPAASQYQCRAIGCEFDVSHYNTALARIHSNNELL